MREYMAAVGEEASEGVEGAYGRRIVEMEAWYTVVESVVWWQLMGRRIFGEGRQSDGC